MRFNSLSEAVRYYAYAPNALGDLSPYSDIANQVNKVPSNINYIDPASPSVLIYGKSIWGIGKVIDVEKPKV